MIEQEITRLVNQSEKKGRFIIQELDDEINVLEKSQVLPTNVEKYFSKKTKHSSICNNNKIIHLLHNQSENPNLNQNFSTFIFEDNSKIWIDFDLIWKEFSQFHCDVSENNMEKIFNYTDLKSENDENNENNNSSYFNDSLNINNINNINYNNVCYDKNLKMLFSNKQISNLGEKAKKPANPSNDNLTNVQTTHDISHSNIADIGMLSNTTSTQFKNFNNEINFHGNQSNSNSNGNSNNINSNHYLCKDNATVINNDNSNNNVGNSNVVSASCNGDKNDLFNGNHLLDKNENCFSAEQDQETHKEAADICARLLKDKGKEGFVINVKFQKIENEEEKSKLYYSEDVCNKQETITRSKLADASNIEAAGGASKIQILNSNNNNRIITDKYNNNQSNNNLEAESINNKNQNNNLNCNTITLEEILSSDAKKPNYSKSNYNSNNNNNLQSSLLSPKAEKALSCEAAAVEATTNNSPSNTSISISKNANRAEKTINEKHQNSPSKIKNLEINFCEKRIINSPAFSPINSDYCHKFDKINLDLNSLVNENFSKQPSEKFKLKSSDRLIFLDEYFKEEKNQNSKKRQKRIFSEFKPNRNFENKNFFSNLKISSNVNNFCFIPENKKILNAKILRKKKISKAKRNVNLQISENLEIEISAGNGNLDENSNDENGNNNKLKEKEKNLRCFDEKQNKNLCENYFNKEQNYNEIRNINNENSENRKEFVCCSCGNKNVIVD